MVAFWGGDKAGRLHAWVGEVGGLAGEAGMASPGTDREQDAGAGRRRAAQPPSLSPLQRWQAAVKELVTKHDEVG